MTGIENDTIFAIASGAARAAIAVLRLSGRATGNFGACPKNPVKARADKFNREISRAAIDVGAGINAPAGRQNQPSPRTARCWTFAAWGLILRP